MKITKTQTNKLVSFVDRYFTYDWRILGREEPNENFDFLATSYDDDHKTVVAIDRLDSQNLYLSIRKDDKYVLARIARSYKDIETFKKMVRCLG